MPCRAIQKLSVRKGCMLLCACDPPALLIALGAIATRLLGGAHKLEALELARPTEDEGVLVLAA